MPSGPPALLDDVAMIVIRQLTTLERLAVGH